MDFEEVKNKLEDMTKNELIELIMSIYQKQDERISSYIDNRLNKDDYSTVAAFFKKRINNWIESNQFINYNSSFDFAEEIADLREEITETLLPSAPDEAWRLADFVLRNDGSIIENVDDSGGAVGTELNQFCILWLEAAAGTKKADEYWIPLIMDIADGNDYGCRELILNSADILFTPDSLQKIYYIYKNRLLDWDCSNIEGYDHTAAGFEINMEQIAIAMHNPAAYEEALRIRNPEPNNLQIKRLIQIYLQFSDFKKARELLEETTWQIRFNSDRDELYKKLFELTGDTEQLRILQERKWKENPCLYYLKEYHSIAEPGTHKKILAEAVKTALNDPQPERAVPVLLYLNKIAEAEQRLINDAADFETLGYTSILNILEQLGPDNALCGQVVLYRALLNDILRRAYSKAYKYGIGYLRELIILDERITQYPDNLESHADYFSRIKAEHGRKRSFWEKARKYGIDK
ncbi:MAG: hypothetical protein PQJ61_09630 [Spirochaetales bacterium]|uniref:Uncharacterized protein n=1 Tax=Candidatus Thalassospirochaeta sargassi TaxID=3119039 RepID=A0AAJ1MKP4_9SPIO|nr:hypothetical protein [Spirochaetales bacterium]